MDPANHTCFHDSFLSTTDNIAKCLSTSKTVAAVNHLDNCATLCSNLALNPLIVMYRVLVLILIDFVRKYRKGVIAHRTYQAKYRMV